MRLQVKIPAPMGTERSAGGPESIAEAADLLAGAKVASHLYYFHSLHSLLFLQNPVIISGGGVVMGGGVEAVVQLAEALKASQLFYILIPIIPGIIHSLW